MWRNLGLFWEVMAPVFFEMERHLRQRRFFGCSAAILPA